MQFSNEIIDWYSLNKRDLPWRAFKDPYKIWLSEIILQQTQVQQGLPYYERFIGTFPTLRDLALASENEVLKLWQGLGYYSRARNLHETAKNIYFNFFGEFPNTFESLLKLKGIGKYTAAAIASIAFKEVVPVVDGNVFRVLSRIYGIDNPINTEKGRSPFFEFSQSLIDKKQPDIYNQAVMEFGALHCTPLAPKCSNCIFNSSCYAFSKNRISQLPVKTGKIKTRNRFFDYFHIELDGYTYIYKREARDIWKNLYEFPLVESVKESTEPPFNTLIEDNDIVLSLKKEIKHTLSHQIIHARFWKIDTLGKQSIEFLKKNYLQISTKKIHTYPVSRLTEKYLESIAN